MALLNAKHPSGKLARWGEIVAEFDLDIKYRPECRNANADALSRSPDEPRNFQDEEPLDAVQVGVVMFDQVNSKEDGESDDGRFL